MISSLKSELHANFPGRLLEAAVDAKVKRLAHVDCMTMLAAKMVQDGSEMALH
jgi:hypothetical protein